FVTLGALTPPPGRNTPAGGHGCSGFSGAVPETGACSAGDAAAAGEGGTAWAVSAASRTGMSIRCGAALYARKYMFSIVNHPNSRHSTPGESAERRTVHDPSARLE